MMRRAVASGTRETDGVGMRTIGEVARLSGLTVRTLRHYDQIALVQPSDRSPAGYRLYNAADLDRLHLVLFYRELDLPLEEIRRLLSDPAVDRGAVLRNQRHLLSERMQRLHAVITAVDAAIAANVEGTTMSDEIMFAVFGEEQRAVQAEASARWGDTDAWAATRTRTAHLTTEDWAELKQETDAILRRIADVYRSGAAPDSAAALDAVEAHRVQIERRFYPCSHVMQVSLAEMYVADERFAATYEALAAGLTPWVHDAIVANADRAVRVAGV